MTRGTAGARTAVRWPKCAANLAEALPISRLHPAVVAWARRAPSASTWSIAFSGGADSLGVLLLVWAHWPRHRRRMRALHFDHCLRGAESRADAEFCRRVSRALGIRIVVEKWKNAPREATESQARAARQKFFERYARVLWFGHQQNDIAETMFMRLSRGSGTGGLAAPRPCQKVGKQLRLRPLLTISKSELVNALRASGAVWREDSTNAGDAFFRNRIRRGVVPRWIRAAERDALAGAARSRDLLEEDDSALEAWLAEIRPLSPTGILAVRRLEGKPRGLVRRALHQWIQAQRSEIRISRQAFDALLDAVISGRPTRQSVGNDGFAVLAKGALRFASSRKIGR